MKRPNLQYNYYFPFYTQNIQGKKSNLNFKDTYMHLSDKKAICLSVRCMKKNIEKIHLRFIDSPSALYKYKNEYNKITYTDFAEAVNVFYSAFSKAIKKLTDEPAYRKDLIFSTLLKFNPQLEVEIDWKEITVNFRETDYKIEHGKIVRLKESPFAHSTDEVSKKWEAIGIAFDENTNYRIVGNDVFDERLNDCWESFRQFFEAPKFIRKNEYVPK